MSHYQIHICLNITFAILLGLNVIFAILNEKLLNECKKLNRESKSLLGLEE